ncbi:hypothetical protein TNCV_4214501 [Trichonephila clavipes]|nr:hypothetical protein TNCV_4214501 [Trichonephila clavipes]
MRISHKRLTIWKTTLAVLLPIYGHKCWKKSSKIGRLDWTTSEPAVAVLCQKSYLKCRILISGKWAGHSLANHNAAKMSDVFREKMALNRRFLLGVWTVNNPQSHIVRVYDAGHCKSGVFHSAEWHDGDWSSDGIREAWLWFFIWVESLSFLAWLRAKRLLSDIGDITEKEDHGCQFSANCGLPTCSKHSKRPPKYKKLTPRIPYPKDLNLSTNIEEATKELFSDGPRNFEPWSSDENDT